MKILVINAGSSSIKYQLLDMDYHITVISGMLEKIGEQESILNHKKWITQTNHEKKTEHDKIHNHQDGLNRILSLLMDPTVGAIKDKSEIIAVGHRVVHGGETFQSPCIIDQKVITAIQENIPLAPLHNPPNLIGIETAQGLFPDIPHVAVFDTAFHQTIPSKAFLYALPYNLYKEDRVRRYGFHGTSHAYVTEKAAQHLSIPVSQINAITIHLGNGASMAAIKNGQCIDTTMGMTPLEGLVMGTRCGDVDPALPFFLTNHLNMSLSDIDSLLNRKSGLKGLCGSNDMREVIEKSNQNDPHAQTALDVYCYRIKKYIGAYLAVIGSLNAIVFTAGIGENAPIIRQKSLSDLDHLGIQIDQEKNNDPSAGIAAINSHNSNVQILVVPTNEELKIAQETLKVIEGN